MMPTSALLLALELRVAIIESVDALCVHDSYSLPALIAPRYSNGVLDPHSTHFYEQHYDKACSIVRYSLTVSYEKI